MSQTIRTYADLCAERERLQVLLASQKQRVVEDWNGLKDELSPVKNAFGIVGKMAKGDKTNPLVNVGLKLASDLLLKNFVLAKAGWATKLAVPFVVKNYSSHLLADSGRSIFGKLGKLFGKKKHHNGASSSSNSEPIIN
jgi:hypothetical protein